MSVVPHTYAEWSEIIKELRNAGNDEEVLAAMKLGTLKWQSGVAERFTQKFLEAINSRMNRAADRFQKSILRANGQESEIISALLFLRKEMAFLKRVTDLPVLPEQERSSFRNIVIDQAKAMQHSLEETAKRDRSGRLSSIVRNQRVDMF